MRNWFGCVAATIAIACCGGAAQAQVSTLAYSFETVTPAGPDGFFGLGANVFQATTGATNQLNSMQVDLLVGGFVGARTETVIPPQLGDPPGVNHVLFDLTITTAYTGTFADIGVTVFGHVIGAPPSFGNQVQFADTVSFATLAPGTYTDQRIDLDTSVGPYRSGESFDQIVGPGPNDLTVISAFQFFFSKNAANTATVFIDNVRLVTAPVPEPGTLCLSALGAVGLGAIRRRRRAARG